MSKLRVAVIGVGHLGRIHAKLLSQARKDAFETTLEVERWADEIFSTLEANFKKFIGAVRQGRQRLHERSSKESAVAGHIVDPSSPTS